MTEGDATAASPAVYPVLRALEEAGRIRRGYFVDGLGAAQFALAGALDRLRAARDDAEDRSGDASTCWPPRIRPTRTVRRSPWPRRGEADRRPLQRAAGAYVVLVDGVAAAVPGARRVHAPDAPRVRRPGGRRRGRPWPGHARPIRPRPRARDPQGRRRAGRRAPRPGPRCSRRASWPATAA